jgi:hypothetical protein
MLSSMLDDVTSVGCDGAVFEQLISYALRSVLDMLCFVRARGNNRTVPLLVGMRTSTP